MVMGIIKFCDDFNSADTERKFLNIEKKLRRNNRIDGINAFFSVLPGPHK